MHEARWNREKDDADNKRTRASTLSERPSRTQASNERTSRQGARAALFEHVVAARAAPVEHSALPRRLQGHQSSISRFRSRFERHLSSILRLRGTLEQPFRARCGAGPGPSGHFASQLRLWARLERPFRANSGSGPGSMSQTSAGVVFSSQAEPSRGRPGISEPVRFRG